MLCLIMYLAVYLFELIVANARWWMIAVSNGLLVSFLILRSSLTFNYKITSCLFTFAVYYIQTYQVMMLIPVLKHT